MTHLIECDGNGMLHDAAGADDGRFPLLFEDMESEHFNLTSPCGRLSFSSHRFAVRETVTLDERMAANGLYRLSFCLGEGMEPSLEGARDKTMRFESGEGRIMLDGAERSVTEYLSGTQYQGASVAFDAQRVQEVAQCLKRGRIVFGRAGVASISAPHALTARVASLLAQISTCTMEGALKNLFVEAKLLELVAVYLSETLCQQDSCPDELPMSRDDLSALRRARAILDRSFAHPPTIAALAQKALINEFKLKTGFKQCFGTTVYGYVADKRMEAARLLLEQGRYRVKDVARMVGYANVSHFIEAFSKKYGTTPGRY